MNKIARYIICNWKIINIKSYMIFFATFIMLESIIAAIQYLKELNIYMVEQGNVWEYVIYNMENVFVIYLFLPVVSMVFCLMSVCFEKTQYLYMLKCHERKTFLIGNLVSMLGFSFLFVTLFIVISMWCGVAFGMNFTAETLLIETPFGLIKGIILIYVSLSLYWFTLMLWFLAIYYLVLNRWFSLIVSCIPILFGFIVFKNLLQFFYKFTFFYQIIQSVVECEIIFRALFWIIQICVLMMIIIIRANGIDLCEQEKYDVTK